MKRQTTIAPSSALHGCQSAPWLVSLMAEIHASSLRKVAKKLGHTNHTKLSQIMAGNGRYGEKKSDGSFQIDSARMLEREWREVFTGIACPYLAKKQGEVVLIKRTECNSYACGAVPTSSPARMEHWQACQGCEHKSKE